jgi:hypothetical protein
MMIDSGMPLDDVRGGDVPKVVGRDPTFPFANEARRPAGRKCAT